MSTLHQIALTFIKGIGPVSARALIAYFGNTEEVFKASPSKLARVPGLGKRGEQMNVRDALIRAEEELKYVEDYDINVLFYTDEGFPKRLKRCNDAPVLLYTKGNISLNKHKVVSIVGTRKATDYGKQLCKQLVEELKQYDVLVVSGLAFGIDVAAHKECVNQNMQTVGVLGHGLDRLYPAQHWSVAEKMMLNGGLVSEYPFGTIPDREHFPERNRIVAGMADATVIIEASIKGGALITAEIADSYNRDVFAFPGRVNDELSEGCNFLIRNNKAALLTGVADLAYSLGWEKVDSTKAPEQLALPIDLNSDEQLIFDIIRQYSIPVGVDDLAIKAAMPMSQLAMNLLNMEMQGYIRSLPGKMYAIG